MKALKFLFVLIALTALSFQAMPQASSFETNTSTLKVWYWTDTIANTGTVTGVYPYNIPAGWSYSVQVVADSLSGATAGNLYLKASNSVNGTEYETLQTLVLNGVKVTDLWEVTTQTPNVKLEVTATGSGTMSCKVRAWFVLKKIPVY